MRLIRLEAHLFREKCEQPSFGDVSGLIEDFHKYELMPQYVMENNAQLGVKTKRMQLTNQIENLSITFHSDKVLIAKDYSPNRSEQFNEDAELFIEFVRFALGKLIKIIPNFNSHRVSLVCNCLYFLDSQKRNAIAQKLTHSIMEDDESSFSEIKFRFGVRNYNDTAKEVINTVVTLNDGEAEIVENGQVNKSLCLLNNVDINTLGENTQARFDIDHSLELIESYKVSMNEKLKQLVNFFEG